MRRPVPLEPPSTDRSAFGPTWRRQTAERAKPKLACELRLGIRQKVSGEAHPMGSALRSPFTGAPCVFWRVEIVRRRRVPARGALARVLRKQVEEWDYILAETSADPFLIADANGERVLVDPREAVLSITRSAIDPPSLDGALGALLLRHGTTPREIRQATELDWFESLLVPGAKASAWGIVTSVSEVVASGYRDASSVARRIASTQVDRAVVIDV